jgi:hypothetical protein
VVLDEPGDVDPASFDVDDPDEPAPPDEPDPLDALEPSDVESAESPDALEDEPGLRVAARSFFAQPLPLKTMAGGANPFFRVPSAPHSGQNAGAGSLIPWRMSVRWPQAEQVYS